ncbi:hypothetical protein PV326_011597 [Microctonus aethiopoides]|nr:hypothetical protein PV326_011597 [Microctonus aethiopoides]
MEGLFRVLVNKESRIKAAVDKQSTPYCGGCEEIHNHYYLKYMFSNCKSYSSVKGCPDSEKNYDGKSIRYSSFTADSQTFGQSEQCNHTSYELTRSAPRLNWCTDDICVCSVNITTSNYMPTGKKTYSLYDNMNYYFEQDLHIDDPKIMKISVEPQYSKIRDNMVVVGVQFILYENAIHLQIQQSKITQNTTTVQKAVWKPVDVDSENENMHINISYANVHYYRSSIYLDDVMVHPDFLVTGVKLVPTKKGDGFELHVHATQFDAKTGVLDGLQRWFEPGEYSPNPQDYKRNRTQITMDDPDNPIMRNNYYPDPETNKFIQFQHTSVKKDAGYHTVPFFDGQSVQSPEFPLGGVGLFYRHQNGFGGYIAPRLFTYNITRDIEYSFNAWQKIEEAYGKCGLQVPQNPKELDEHTTCETLGQIANKQIEKQNVDDTKYTTNPIHGQSTFNNNSPTLNTRHDSTGNDDARNTISKGHY